MTIDDKIGGEKIKCDINREASKISTLSAGEYYTFIYSLL